MSADPVKYPFAEGPERYATLSACGQYRYWLTRVWGFGSRVGFCLLNPSRADASVDDATIRRLTRFALDWGFRGFDVVNLYALRSPEPAALWSAADPVGPDNDYFIRRWGRCCKLLVCGWGAQARAERVAAVLPMLSGRELHCLGVTKGGSPRHPLYLRRDARPMLWINEQGRGPLRPEIQPPG